jgi:hypothetical protein
MAKTEHTPGSWYKPLKDSPYWLGGAPIPIAGKDGVLVARVANERVEMRANARLIAAAPDLLEACEAIVAAAEKWNDGDFSLGDVTATSDIAEAAILKAKGA